MNEWPASQWRERNEKVIAEFRANGGNQASANPLLLLTTNGAKSGRPHITPLMYLSEGDRFVVFASKGGNPTHPAWYHNLVANPTVTVEVSGDTFEAEAVIAEPAERDRIYALQAEIFPMFADYQAKTEWRIPVVILERQADQPRS